MCMTKKVQVKENERERHLSSPDTSHQHVTALSLVCFCVGDRKKIKNCAPDHMLQYINELFSMQFIGLCIRDNTVHLLDT